MMKLYPHDNLMSNGDKRNRSTQRATEGKAACQMCPGQKRVDFAEHKEK